MHRTFRLPPRRPAPLVPGRRPGLTSLAGGHPALPPLGLTPEKPGVALRAINLHTSPRHDGTACVSPAPGGGAGATERAAREDRVRLSPTRRRGDESPRPPRLGCAPSCARGLSGFHVRRVELPPPVGAGHVPARKRTCDDTQTNLETASARTRSNITPPATAHTRHDECAHALRTPCRPPPRAPAG